MAEFRWEEIDASDGPGGPLDRHAWLRRVARGLDALPDVEAGTLDELASHLDDRTADEVAHGSSKRVAEQRAMDRLGDPVALGRELARARVARRSRLAVAGGGMLAMSGYTVAGTVMGFALLVVPVWIVKVAAALLGYQMGAVTTASPDGYAMTAALGVGLVWACGAVPAVMARRGARSFLAAGRWVAAVIVALGFPIALWLPERQVDLPIAVISLAIPVLAAVAALNARRSRELQPTPLVIVVAIVALLLPTFIWPAPGTGGPIASLAYWDPSADPVLASLMAPVPDGVVQPECDPPQAETLSSGGTTTADLTGVKTNGWTKFRLQSWQLQQQSDGTWSAAAQLLDAPFTQLGSELRADYVTPSPRVRAWYASFITAVDPKGVRRAVLVSAVINQTPPWRGSVWDWATGQS